MDDQELKQLRYEVTQLQKIVAAQGQYMLLLLALARTGVQPHRADIEKAIDTLPFQPTLETKTGKQEAKKLIPVYFP